VSSKREKTKFVRQIEKHLTSLGGSQGPPEVGLYDWTIETKYGILRIRIDTDGPRNSGPGMVYARFDDPKRARSAGVDCNQYTGKWNHYYGRGWAPPMAAFVFCQLLDKIGEKSCIT
jgi:hypothetical protein